MELGSLAKLYENNNTETKGLNAVVLDVSTAIFTISENSFNGFLNLFNGFFYQ